MDKKGKKKLVLAKETVRELGKADLQKVLGQLIRTMGGTAETPCND